TVVPEDTTVDGVPFTIMLRHALQYGGSIDEVIDIIKNTPRTVGLNILVADAARREAVVLEVSAYRMTVRHADSSTGVNFIYGANRFLTPYLKEYQKAGWISSAFRESRFERLKQVFLHGFKVEDAVRILRDKGTDDPDSPVFLPSIQNHATISSMVFDPARLELWVSAPGCRIPPVLTWCGLPTDWRGASRHRLFGAMRHPCQFAGSLLFTGCPRLAGCSLRHFRP